MLLKHISLSSSSHAMVTYTSVSTNNDLPPWGFHLMKAYEPEVPEAAPQSPKQAPLSPVPFLEYPEYLAPSDDDILVEDQPLPADASPAALSPGGRGGAFGFDDPASPVPDPVPSSEETEQFETDESAATPPSPHIVVSLSQTGLRRATKYATAPTPPSPLPSPLLLLSSPLPLIQSPPFPLPSLDRKGTIPEANMPPRKRACFTTPSRWFVIEKSSTVAAAREPGSTLARGIDYGFIDTLDASSRAIDERVMTALEEDERALLQAQVSTLRRERQYHCHMAMLVESEAMYARQAWSQAMDCKRAVHAELLVLSTKHEHDRLRELQCTRDAEYQDGPADAGSSC
ncbi:hypothetical protein Tco_0127868 [Tanacetum coccineum]